MKDSTDSIDTLELLQESCDELGLDNSVEDQISGKSSSQSFRTITPSVNSISNSVVNDKNYQEFIDDNQKPAELTTPLIMDLELYKKEDVEQLMNNLDLNLENNSNDIENDVETADLEHLEPKLKAAWIKMRKLDKILEKVLLKEKKVKIETQQLITRNRKELELIRLTSDHKESKSEAENTAHFLSLSYVNVDDDDVLKDLNIKIEPSTPVFKTQLPDTDRDSNNTTPLENNQINKQIDNEINIKKNNKPGSVKSSNNSHSNTHKTQNTNKNKKNSLDSLNVAQEKNFIKRNIQLAKDMGGVLSMTDEEKLRLNQLIIDIDEFDKENEGKKMISDQDGQLSQTVLAEYNPKGVKLAQGDGFMPDQTESNRLKQIDSILEKRMSARSGSSRIFSSSYLLSKSKFSNTIFESVAPADLLEYQAKEIKLNDDFDENEFGDKFIREARLTREQEQRLKLIDSQLEFFKTPDIQNDVSSQSSINDIRFVSKIPLVNETTIKELLEECSLENVQMISDMDRQKTFETLIEEESENGLAMSSYTKSEVRLDNGIIQQLISQAKNEGIFVTAEQDYLDNNDTDIHSFYEEALNLMNDSSRKSLMDLNNAFFDVLTKESNKDLAENLTNNFISSNHHSIENKVDLQKNDDREGIFPSLVLNDDEKNEEGRNSSLSNLSVNSALSLPKINSRFLPKQK